MPALAPVRTLLSPTRAVARCRVRWLCALICLGISAWAVGARAIELTWQELPPLPDTVGLGGPFVGAIGEHLIVAGGTNFPEKPIWEGGKKVWYDDIYILEPGGRWRKAAQKLPRPLAYGVCISRQDRLVLIGGSDAGAHYREVFELRLDHAAGDGAEPKFRPLPPLPKTCAMMSGALVGGNIYIAGGVETPEATQAMHTFWRFSIAPTRAAPRWRELDPWPGPQRHAAIAAAESGTFYLISGIRLQASREGKPEPASPYLSDAYAFQHERLGPGTWKKIAGPPKPIAAAASPAWSLGRELLVFSGIDHTGLGIDPRKYPSFPRTIRAYDRRDDRWRDAGEMPEGSSRVTAGATAWRGGYVIASGETGPSRRSPKVYWVRAAEGK